MAPKGCDTFLASCLNDLSAPHRLRRLRPRQIASVLRSLVRLGVHPGEDWLAELDAACYCHPGPFDPASATAVLKYLAALHAATAQTLSAAAGPQAAALRLLQGGVSKYKYEQLAMLLQAFRRLGMTIDDELALAVGRQMAGQLAGMAPGRRAAALRAVIGPSGGSA
ncbi:hypothetical protein GPECTOR_11g279 [Gonium pectorale]|uniref:Uncharacterized protein n=1 Tax=Gonium pectorale TaxID=33097 RepID=A0A150GR79_GONPE|nr:hypothetical protein GPECTOR_11g279 [Gonium pectorale]|eukprot:KXZ51840.1 hypothetical protein GPECTOR_11g279 [Gonium pectorale]